MRSEVEEEELELRVLRKEPLIHSQGQVEEVVMLLDSANIVTEQQDWPGS